MDRSEPPTGSAAAPLVVLRITRGWAGPRSVEVATTPITVGRSSAATLRFDPHRDRGCASGVHASIEFCDGIWWIECRHARGVVIRGGPSEDAEPRRVEEGQRESIALPVEIELGPGGPRFEIAPADGPLPETVLGEKQFETDQPLSMVPSSVLSDSRRSKRLISVVMACMLLLTLGLVGVFWLADRESGIEPPSPTPTIDPRGSSEMDETRRSALEAITEARDSVWRVGYRDEAGNFVGAGSAFVVRSDHLATNAHVAISLQEHAENGMVLESRTPTRPDARLRIEVGAIHPAYAFLKSLGESDRFAQGSSSDPSPMFETAGDVALLRIVEGDPGRPIPLRDPRRDGQVRVNEVVTVMGFPGVVDGGKALMSTGGIVSNLTDPFMQEFIQESFRESPLVHHTASTFAGSSGSPILDDQGRVVAVHASGLYLGGELPIGVNRGPHVAMVRELLDGDADLIHAEQESLWRRRFERIYSHWEDVARSVHESLNVDLSDRTGEVDPRSAEIVLDRDGREHGVSHRFKQAAGERLIVVACPGAEYALNGIDLDAAIADSGLLDEAVRSFAVLQIEAGDSEQDHLVDVWAAQMRTRPCRVSIRVIAH